MTKRNKLANELQEVGLTILAGLVRRKQLDYNKLADELALIRLANPFAYSIRNKLLEGKYDD